MQVKLGGLHIDLAPRSQQVPPGTDSNSSRCVGRLCVWHADIDAAFSHQLSPTQTARSLSGVQLVQRAQPAPFPVYEQHTSSLRRLCVRLTFPPLTLPFDSLIKSAKEELRRFSTSAIPISRCVILT